MAKASAALIGRFGEVLGTEIVTEVMQETVTAVTGDLIREDGQGMPLSWEGYTDRMANVAMEVMQGAAIMSMMGPGMSYYVDLRRAREAERMAFIYGQLGVVETHDQAAAARVISERAYVDEERVGIWGWSYGGFMSLNTLFQHGDVYSTAVAVAPVPSQASAGAW